MKSFATRKLGYRILLFALLLHSFFAGASPYVTNLQGFYKHGQVFLTWNKIQDNQVSYKVYRSPLQIVSSTQLSQCEYLGWISASSSKDFNLSNHDGASRYLVIDSLAGPLLPAQGLFVALSLANGNYFYAVTSVKNGVENDTIVPSMNSLQFSIHEIVTEPQPVFQQKRIIDNDTISIYAFFNDMKNGIGASLMNKAGFFATDFAVYLNGASGLRPMRIHFRPGGGTFLDNITNPIDSEIVLNPEDYFPNGRSSGWWGANVSYEIYDSSGIPVPPTSGLNYNYSQHRLTHIINWALSHLPVDSNRIYLEGSSFGTAGAYFYAMTYPERIAAVKLTSGCFNFAFENDFNPFCTLNMGNSNRIDGDERFGTVSTNLMCNLDYSTYDMFNGGWLSSQFNDKPYPVIFSINGRRDTLIGWTEKTIYFDSVNATHLGGYYLWDNRTHSGNDATWSDNNFNMFRYRRNLSFPAFSDCNVNGNPGNGDANNGDVFGSINGFLDWKTAVADEEDNWTCSIFLRDLIKRNGATYGSPDSCLVAISPRRLQHFQPQAGDLLEWQVKYHNQVIQGDQFVYSGGLMTVPDVKIFKDTVEFKLSYAIPLGNHAVDTSDFSAEVIPNPVSNVATIKWRLQHSGKCSVKIFNVDGSELMTLANNEMAAGDHELFVDTNSSNQIYPGVFLLCITSGDEVETKKLVVMH